MSEDKKSEVVLLDDNQQPPAAPVQQQPLPLVARELTVDELITRVDKIKHVMKAVMQKDVHYGTIPGTSKPTLLQPGAMQLCITFGFRPEFHVVKTPLQDGHMLYTNTCTLFNTVGHSVGQGVAECSTMESRYRFRKLERTCPKCGLDTIFKSKEEYGGGWFCWKNKGGCGETFDKGDMHIEGQKVGKEEHDNPADYYNTCMKIGAKRAYVAATLFATGAADLFTQDMEDIKANESHNSGPTVAPKPEYKDNGEYLKVIDSIGNEPLVWKFLEKLGHLKDGQEFKDLPDNVKEHIVINEAQFRESFSKWADTPSD